MSHSIIIYIPKANWRDSDGLFALIHDFKGFSIFLGLFTSISSYFDPQIAPRSTTRHGINTKSVYIGLNYLKHQDFAKNEGQ